ncbi:DUF5320 domain-containing protein [Thermotoga sp. SG1]|uniref:DUF5320 domain-containing protein n=1 Tax=Thermotoga sp. SG1 TaxID=126739 RepID=UPI000C7869A9|nr:DUF5320 domain-containing protein [Thermotoga sp. SG1]
MPRLDGTGPMGLGPMTGRGLGWCRYILSWTRPWKWRRGFRMGLAWRHRRGWGWRRW